MSAQQPSDHEQWKAQQERIAAERAKRRSVSIKKKASPPGSRHANHDEASRKKWDWEQYDAE